VLSAKHLPNGDQELIARSGFHDITQGAYPEDPLAIDLLVVNRHDENWKVRMRSLQLFNELESVVVRKGKTGHYNIRGGLFDEGKGLSRSVGFAADLKIVFTGYQVIPPPTRDFVDIYDEDTTLRTGLHCKRGSYPTTV
jgi:hypothetical protein